MGGYKRRRQVGGGGASLVQCNGRGSCEKRSPLFPTPGPMRTPRFSRLGSSHISNTCTGPADSDNAYTPLIYFMYAHRQKHTLVYTRDEEAEEGGTNSLCDRRRRGGARLRGRQRFLDRWQHCLIFILQPNKLTSCNCVHKHTCRYHFSLYNSLLNIKDFRLDDVKSPWHKNIFIGAFSGSQQ